MINGIIFFAFEYILLEVFMSDINLNDFMKMISKMDKKELQSKLAQASQMLNNQSPEEIIKQMNNNNKN